LVSSTEMDMSSTPILLLGGKGGSVSEGVYKCLRLAGYENITILEYTQDAALLYRVASSTVSETTPDAGHDYIKEVIGLCNSRHFRIIAPGATWEAQLIAQYAEEFRSNGLTCLTNKSAVIDICANKWKTYEFLLSHGVRMPTTVRGLGEARQLLETSGPVIVKPEAGRGSQYVYKANNVAELEAVSRYLEVMAISYIVQEYLADDQHEYTVGVVSAKDGLMSRSIVMQRHLWGGATGYARVIEPGPINAWCEDIARKLGSSGPLNIQLRLDRNQNPAVIEINPRFSGSAPMRALGGFNEPDMIIRNFYLDEPLPDVPIHVDSQYYRVFQELVIQPGSRSGDMSNLL
jgi:carbamoyl-phosphate synthase large subunit